MPISLEVIESNYLHKLSFIVVRGAEASDSSSFSGSYAFAQLYPPSNNIAVCVWLLAGRMEATDSAVYVQLFLLQVLGQMTISEIQNINRI